MTRNSVARGPLAQVVSSDLVSFPICKTASDGLTPSALLGRVRDGSSDTCILLLRPLGAVARGNARQVVARTDIEPHPRAFLAGDDAEPLMLDLVQRRQLGKASGNQKAVWS